MSWPSLKSTLTICPSTRLLIATDVVGLDRADAVEEDRDILRGDGSRGDRDCPARRLCRRRRHLGAVAQSPDRHDRRQRKDYDCSDRTPYHPERLPNPSTYRGASIYHRQTIRVTRSSYPWIFCRSAVDAAAALSAQRHLYRGAIRAPRHQAIFDAGALSELSDENHPGNRQRQDDDQPDQRRRPSLVGSVLAVFGSIIHRPADGSCCLESRQ